MKRRPDGGGIGDVAVRSPEANDQSSDDTITRNHRPAESIPMLPSRLKFFNDRFLRRPKRFMVAISCLMLLASASRLACANPQTSSISSDISVVLSSQSASSSNCFCEAPQSLYEYSQDGLEDVDDDDHVDDIWDDPLGEIGYLLSTLSPFSDPALDAKAHEVPDEPRSKKRSHQTKARPRYPRRDPQSGPRVIVLVLIPVFIWLFYNYYKSRKDIGNNRRSMRHLPLGRIHQHRQRSLESTRYHAQQLPSGPIPDILFDHTDDYLQSHSGSRRHTSRSPSPHRRMLSPGPSQSHYPPQSRRKSRGTRSYGQSQHGVTHYRADFSEQDEFTTARTEEEFFAAESGPSLLPPPIFERTRSLSESSQTESARSDQPSGKEMLATEKASPSKPKKLSIFKRMTGKASGSSGREIPVADPQESGTFSEEATSLVSPTSHNASHKPKFWTRHASSSSSGNPEPVDDATDLNADTTRHTSSGIRRVFRSSSKLDIPPPATIPEPSITTPPAQSSGSNSSAWFWARKGSTKVDSSLLDPDAPHNQEDKSIHSSEGTNEHTLSRDHSFSIKDKEKKEKKRDKKDDKKHPKGVLSEDESERKAKPFWKKSVPPQDKPPVAAKTAANSEQEVEKTEKLDRSHSRVSLPSVRLWQPRRPSVLVHETSTTEPISIPSDATSGSPSIHSKSSSDAKPDQADEAASVDGMVQTDSQGDSTTPMSSPPAGKLQRWGLRPSQDEAKASSDTLTTPSKKSKPRWSILGSSPSTHTDSFAAVVKGPAIPLNDVDESTEYAEEVKPVTKRRSGSWSIRNLSLSLSSHTDSKGDAEVAKSPTRDSGPVDENDVKKNSKKKSSRSNSRGHSAAEISELIGSTHSPDPVAKTVDVVAKPISQGSSSRIWSIFTRGTGDAAGDISPPLDQTSQRHTADENPEPREASTAEKVAVNPFHGETASAAPDVSSPSAESPSAENVREGSESVENDKSWDDLETDNPNSNSSEFNLVRQRHRPISTRSWESYQSNSSASSYSSSSAANHQTSFSTNPTGPPQSYYARPATSRPHPNSTVRGGQYSYQSHLMNQAQHHLFRQTSYGSMDSGNASFASSNPESSNRLGAIGQSPRLSPTSNTTRLSAFLSPAHLQADARSVSSMSDDRSVSSGLYSPFFSGLEIPLTQQASGSPSMGSGADAASIGSARHRSSLDMQRGGSWGRNDETYQSQPQQYHYAAYQTPQHHAHYSTNAQTSRSRDLRQPRYIQDVSSSNLSASYPAGYSTQSLSTHIMPSDAPRHRYSNSPSSAQQFHPSPQPLYGYRLTTPGAFPTNVSTARGNYDARSLSVRSSTSSLNSFSSANDPVAQPTSMVIGLGRPLFSDRSGSGPRRRSIEEWGEREEE